MNTTQSLRAGVVALALAASAVTVPTAIADEENADAVIASGAVNWPIKESFNRYINMPFVKGTIDTEQVTFVAAENSFDFTVNPAESELDEEGNGTLQLDGSIHYTGHEGMLDLKYSDIKVNIENGTKATITADYHLQGALPGQPEENKDVDDAEISSFELEEALIPEAGKTYSQADLPTTLLQGGADSLLSYDPGDLDDGDVDVSVTFDEAEDVVDPDTDTDTDTGTDTDIDTDQDKDQDKGSSLGGIIAIILAVLSAIGAAFGGFIPGLNLKNFGF